MQFHKVEMADIFVEQPTLWKGYNHIHMVICGPKSIVASFYHRIYTDYKAGRQNDFFKKNSHHFL